MIRGPILTYVKRLGAAATIEDVHAVIKDAAAEELGCTHYMIFFGRLSHDAHTFPGTIFQTEPLCLHNFPPKWSELYHDQALFTIDPVFMKCMRSVMPAIWHEEESLADDTGRKFFAMAREHGLAAGITVPVHARNGGFGSLGLVFGKDDPETRHRIAAISTDVLILAFHAYTNLRRVTGSEKVSQDTLPHLTPREKEVLRWTASGKTVWEISTILTISERTAKQHLDNVFRKLEVHNKYHAVAEAVALGLTKPW